MAGPFACLEYGDILLFPFLAAAEQEKGEKQNVPKFRFGVEDFA